MREIMNTKETNRSVFDDAFLDEIFSSYNMKIHNLSKRVNAVEEEVVKIKQKENKNEPWSK